MDTNNMQSIDFGSIEARLPYIDSIMGTHANGYSDDFLREVFYYDARTYITTLLARIDAQNAALDQAWYVLDAAAAGQAPRSAAIMARTHVEKFVGPRESNF